MSTHGGALGRESEDAAVRAVLEHLPAIWANVTAAEPAPMPSLPCSPRTPA